MNDMEVVSAVRAALADRVGRERFELWFGPSTRLSLRGSALTVEVPNRFVQDWMRTNFRKEIEDCCELALGEPVSLEFRIDSALALLKPPVHARKEPTPKEPQLPRLATQAVEPAEPPAAPVQRRRFATLESFVVGAANRVAFASAEMVANQPGCYSPFTVYGPSGVGKTHLLESIWTAVRRRRPSANVVYLSAEQFTTYFLDALRGGSGLPNFRRKFRQADVLLIDELQFFEGKRATLGEVLQTIDVFVKDGRQLVFSADRAPAELASFSPELATRLSAGMACRLELPDHPTRVGVLRQLFERAGLDSPEDVLDYLATHLTGGVRELMGAVHRLKASSQAWNVPVSRTMAEEALGDLIRNTNRTPKLAEIERAVCQAFGLESQCLQSEKKGKAVNYPRMLAMWLARKHTRAALTEIGSYFGGRSHSTVISAQKKITALLADQTSIDLPDRRVSIDDAIRLAEQQLRVG